jgi:cytochrome c551/c552
MREYFSGKTSLKMKSFFVFLFVGFSCITFPINSNATTEESVISAGHSHNEINRGKRIFMGLLPFDRKYESCVSCHVLKQVDTLNWNPSAVDVALKYADKDFASFQLAVMQPSGVKMTASHKDFDIKEEDLKSVKAYLDDLAHTGTKPLKPSYFNLILFLFLGLLLTWAIIELIFLRKVKWKVIPVIIILGAFGWQVKMIARPTRKVLA